MSLRFGFGVVISHTNDVRFVFTLSFDLRCQFLWIVHFVLPLQYSLSFITTRIDRNGDKGPTRGGNIGKRSENYVNQGRAIGTQNESRP
jgi:hypothetical protein